MLQIASIQRFFISMIVERLFEIWRTHSEGQITLHNAHTRWYFAATSKGDITKKQANKLISIRYLTALHRWTIAFLYACRCIVSKLKQNLSGAVDGLNLRVQMHVCSQLSSSNISYNVEDGIILEYKRMI